MLATITPCQDEVVSRRHRDNTTSWQYVFCRYDVVSTRCRVNTMSCQHDAVSTRHRAKTVSRKKRRRANSTSCQLCVVSTHRCLKTTSWKINVVSIWCLVKTTVCQDGAESTRHRVSGRSLQKVSCQLGAVSTRCRVKTTPCQLDTVLVGAV